MKVAPRQLVAPAALFAVCYYGLVAGMSTISGIGSRLLLAGMSVVGFAIALRLLQNRLTLPFPALVAAMFAAGLLGYLIPGEYAYADSKRTALVITALVVLGGMWLLSSAEALAAWVWLHVAGGLGVLATAAQGETGRLGVNTIATGRMLGAALVVILTMILVSSARRWPMMIAGVGATLALAGGLFATGSRGPALSAGIVVLVIGMRNMSRGGFVRAGLAGIIIWLGYQLLMSSDDAGAGRITGTLSGEISGTATRQPLWLSALHAIPLNPLGVGWGNFATVSTVGSGERSYPHNVVLEATVEGGWLVGLLTAALVAVAVWRLWQRANSPLQSAVLALALFLVANAFVSGDINDNRAMWAVLATAFAVGPRSTEAVTTETPRLSHHARVDSHRSRPYARTGVADASTHPSMVHRDRVQTRRKSPPLKLTRRLGGVSHTGS